MDVVFMGKNFVCCERDCVCTLYVYCNRSLELFNACDFLALGGFVETSLKALFSFWEGHHAIYVERHG